MRFDVRVLSGANRIQQLSVDAGSEEEAVQQLAQQSLRVFEIKRARTLGVGPRAAWGKFSLLLFSQELMALLRAGLNLMEALQGLVEKETASGGRTILEQLIARVRSGQRFLERPG